MDNFCFMGADVSLLVLTSNKVLLKDSIFGD
jgi:hypothetical protein